MSWDLQQAVFAILNGLSPALAPNGVHAPAAQDHPLDYVEIGESDSVSADVQCRDGVEETLTLHVWTKPGSYKLAKQIMGRIRGSLHAVDLAVPGRSSAFAQIRDTRLFLDEGGKALHGVVTLRVTHFSAHS